MLKNDKDVWIGNSYDDPEDLTPDERLERVAEILAQAVLKEHDRQLRLKDTPKGFHLTDGSYSCCICGTYVSGDQSWYDQYGIKCMTCQKAQDAGIFPPEICDDKESWYTSWELAEYLGIKHQTMRKMIRESKLKARIIQAENGKPHHYVFMTSENKEILPEIKPRRKVTVTINSQPVNKNNNKAGVL
jgi:hypothetical protein